MLVVGSVAASNMAAALSNSRASAIAGAQRFGPSQPEPVGDRKRVNPVTQVENTNRPISFTNPALVSTLQEGERGNAAAQKGTQELTEDQQREVDRLKQRDAEVRRHEQAHKAAGGPLASNPTYTFQTGPDGRQYAVGGEVKIDASPVEDDPEATIRKMEIVIRAALAPEQPSAQDRRVAQDARQKQTEARIELQAQRSEEIREGQDASNDNETDENEGTAIAASPPSGGSLSRPFDNSDISFAPNSGSFQQAASSYSRGSQTFNDTSLSPPPIAQVIKSVDQQSVIAV